MSNSATPWTAACQASLCIANSWSLLTLMSVELMMSSNHLILCRPLLLLPSIFPSIRVFSNESVLCISWPKYWSFSFNISSSSEYLGLISFRIDWFALLAVQGTFKSLLHHSSKASILWRSWMKNISFIQKRSGSIYVYVCPVTSVVSDFATPWTAPRLLCPWDFPGKITRVGCHFLLQGIFPTQESSPRFLCLPHCRWILYHWATRETPAHVTGNLNTVIKHKPPFVFRDQKETL